MGWNGWKLKVILNVKIDLIKLLKLLIIIILLFIYFGIL